MRLIDADVLISDLAHDVKMDEDSLIYEDLTNENREIIQFDKDCKQNTIDLLHHVPTIEERKTGRWERLMMYLADLQLTYSPNWGANGCGDEKLYEFVTGLIEELEGWEDGGEHE